MPTLKKKLDKYQAIRLAEDATSQIYKTAEGWRFDSLNLKTGMFEASIAGPHAVIRTLRTKFRVNRARKLLGKPPSLHVTTHWMNDV
jgi:hypothetical protein